jgi:RNA polymerase sigma-70 factor (ECF subfamily)
LPPADAITRLFAAEHPRLVRYLTRLTGDTDRAADAAQEAFVRLIDRPPAIPAGTDPSVAMRAWLYTVATNVVREGGRTQARRARLLAAGAARAPIADPPRDAHAGMEADERRRAVRAALAALSDKERTALLMREEGFAHREIAGAVGTTTGSVGTLLARALDKLAAALPLDQDAL